MRKTKEADDWLRPEYRRSDFKGKGVRGKYFKKVMESSNVVVIAPDLTGAFPNAAAVNEALRGILRSRRSRRTVRAGAGRKRAAA